MISTSRDIRETFHASEAIVRRTAGHLSMKASRQNGETLAWLSDLLAAII